MLGSVPSGLSSMEQWLFRGGLNNRQFHMWADSSCKLVRLDQGDAMWMPYGWYAACLCIPSRPGDESAVSFISQPYINKQLASKCPEWEAVSAEQARSTKLPWLLARRSSMPTAGSNG